MSTLDAEAIAVTAGAVGTASAYEGARRGRSGARNRADLTPGGSGVRHDPVSAPS